MSSSRPRSSFMGGRNVRVTVRAEVDNSWLDVEGDLIQQDSDLVQPFSAPVEYYHGMDGGESWSEGSKETSVYLSALPAGAYTLRLEFVGERQAVQTTQPPLPPLFKPAPPPPPPVVSVHVLVEQGPCACWTWRWPCWPWR